MNKHRILRATAAVVLLGFVAVGIHELIVALFAARFGDAAWLSNPEWRADIVFGGLSALLGLGSVALGVGPRMAAAIAIICAVVFGIGTHATQSLLMPPAEVADRIAPRFVALPDIAALRLRVRIDPGPAMPGHRIHEG